MQRLFPGGRVVGEQARAPHFQPEISWLRCIVEERFELSPRIVELLLVHREQPVDQGVTVAVVFVRLGLAPLTHQQRDALLVRRFGGRRLLLRFLRLEPVEQPLGLVVKRLVERNLQGALELLLRELDRALRKIRSRFFDALPRDTVGASSSFLCERRMRTLCRGRERLLVRELRGDRSRPRRRAHRPSFRARRGPQQTAF